MFSWAGSVGSSWLGGRSLQSTGTYNTMDNLWSDHNAVWGALADKLQMLPDHDHPNNDGAGEMAKAAFKGLTGHASH